MLLVLALVFSAYRRGKQAGSRGNSQRKGNDVSDVYNMENIHGNGQQVPSGGWLELGDGRRPYEAGGNEQHEMSGTDEIRIELSERTNMR